MQQKKGGEPMRYIYLKSQLKDLTQGSRITFIRSFRKLTQDDVSEKLGLVGENKRRTIEDMKWVIEYQKTIDFWKLLIF